MGLSAHQSTRMQAAVWLTPPHIFVPLGVFDLDPCCPPNMPWSTAKTYFTRREDCTVCGGTGIMPTGSELDMCRSCDGLSQPWHGRVWLNPPFGAAAAKWLRRMKEHGDGIALIPARTETKMFFDSVWGHATGVLFIRSRPRFCRPDGMPAPFNSGAPIALVAYGESNLIALLQSGLGAVVKQVPSHAE